MKKTEAISILATSVRPREPKDRARYDEAVKMAIEALKCSETPKSSEQTAETTQADHIAEFGKKVANEDCISRRAAVDVVDFECGEWRGLAKTITDKLEALPAVLPDRKLIDDYMWKIKQNISPHTAAEGVIAIKYYLEQIYVQVYGEEGEKPKWMT